MQQSQLTDSARWSSIFCFAITAAIVSHHQPDDRAGAPRDGRELRTVFGQFGLARARGAFTIFSRYTIHNDSFTLKQLP